MILSPESHALIVRALESFRSDDLYRARAAFRGCSDVEMNAEYGHSGLTRQGILEEYVVRDTQIDRALAELGRCVK